MRFLISALLCVVLVPTFGLATAAPGAVDPPAPGAAPDELGWPLSPPPKPVRPFEAPEHPFGPGHRGVDLAGASGQPVLAAADGVVIHAGRLVDRELVSIQHDAGLRTSYEPVHPLVETGEHVTRGQPIGRLQPGHCPATCLHWGVRVEEDYLDPLGLLAHGRVRLLPW